MNTPTWQTASPTRGSRPPRRSSGAAAHSIPLGRIFGIPLQLHWSFFLLLGFVAFAESPRGTSAIAGGLIWVAALFASVVLHELAHCLVARRRGGSVLGILLLPIGGMSRMDHIPSNPSDEATIAAVGPATSLVLGAALLAVGALLGSGVWPPTLTVGSWWAILGWLNVVLGVFNLLPALPMDGGRVLRATLARRLPKVTATRIATTVAHVLAVALIVAGVIFDVWLVLIGIFVYLGASSELAQARAEELRLQAQSGPGGVAPRGPGMPPSGGGPQADWPPPWGQEPSPRTRPRDDRSGPRTGAASAIDVSVE